MCLRLQIEIVSDGDFIVHDAARRQLVPDGDDAIEIGERQGFQQECVDGAEDRGVGADAERERDDGDERKGRPPQEISQCVTNIAHEPP